MLVVKQVNAPYCGSSGDWSSALLRKVLGRYTADLCYILFLIIIIVINSLKISRKTNEMVNSIEHYT